MESSNEPRKREADGADLQSVSQWLQRLTKDWWTALTPIAGALATLAAALGLPNGFAQTVAWLIAVSLAVTAVIVVRSKRLRISIDRERNRRVSEFRNSRAQRTSFRGLAPFGYGDFFRAHKGGVKPLRSQRKLCQTNCHLQFFLEILGPAKRCSSTRVW